MDTKFITLALVLLAAFGYVSTIKDTISQDVQ